ncbi:MAG: hypothetical protein EHM33_14035 [Chloroflexi bacterium]|nr:MAG: hypothetical protein EHM33_14035 [Chloroflexota bacterium]
MKLGLISKSLLLFGLSVFLWVVLTLFESALVGMSLTTERVVTFLCLVLPAGLGSVLGWTSLVRKDGRAWRAVAGSGWHNAEYSVRNISFGGHPVCRLRSKRVITGSVFCASLKR